MQRKIIKVLLVLIFCMSIITISIGITNASGTAGAPSVFDTEEGKWVKQKSYQGYGYAEEHYKNKSDKELDRARKSKSRAGKYYHSYKAGQAKSKEKIYRGIRKVLKREKWDEGMNSNKKRKSSLTDIGDGSREQERY